MKDRLLIALTIFLFIPSFTLWSQERRTNEQRRQHLEEFRAKRVDFFTKEIGLTEAESKEFWPVFNELEEKKFELNRNMRREIRKIRDIQNAGNSVSAAEYDRVTNIIIETREKELELEREYLKKIQKILSPEKVFKYLRAEHRFAREAFSPARNGNGARR